MRNLKKFLAVLLVVMLSVTAIVPAFAVPTDSTPVEVAEKLGLLEGSDDGITDEYLAREPERIQAAIVLLRLLGEDDKEINEEYKGEDNFSDYAESAWAEGIMAYLKENPELGFSGNNGKFFPREKITAQQFYKVLLTALGYTQVTAENPDGDFKWEETLTFAKFVGLKELNGKTSLTNEDLAIGITEALVLPIVGDELTLAEDLAFSGAIDLDAAVELGLVDALPAIAEVLPVKDIALAFGAKLELPETVKVKLDNGEEVDAVVEWDVTAVDVNKAGEYKVVGTIEGTDLTAEVKVVVAKELLTATIKADNYANMTITFNKAVNADTLGDNVKIDDVQIKNLKYTLSADKKVLTIAYASLKPNATVKVVIDGVKDAEGVALAKVDTSVVIRDIADPVALSATAVDNKTIEVIFSEPVMFTTGAFVVTDMAGTTNQGIVKIDGAVTFARFSVVPESNKLVVELFTKLADGPHTIDISDVKDAAGFKMAAKQFTVVSTTDVTAPVAQSVTNDGINKVIVTFNENLKNPAIYAALKVTETGNVEKTVKTVTVSDNKLVIELNTPFTAAATLGYSVYMKEVQDKAGNKTGEFTLTGSVSDDTTKPTVAGIGVVTGDTCKNWYKVTFSEAVVLGAAEIKLFKSSDLNTAVKTIDPATLTAVANETNAYYVNVYDGGTKGLDAGSYVLTIDKATDNSIRHNALDKASFSFTSVDDKNPGIASSYILGTGDDYRFEINFDEAMDVSKLSNIANYFVGTNKADRLLSSIANAKVTVSADGKRVVINLPKETAVNTVAMPLATDLAGKILLGQGNAISNPLTISNVGYSKFIGDYVEVIAVASNKIQVVVKEAYKNQFAFSYAEAGAFKFVSADAYDKEIGVIAAQILDGGRKVELTTSVALDAYGRPVISDVAYNVAMYINGTAVKDGNGTPLEVAKASSIAVADKIAASKASVDEKTTSYTFKFNETLTYAPALAGITNADQRDLVLASGIEVIYDGAVKTAGVDYTATISGDSVVVTFKTFTNGDVNDSKLSVKIVRADYLRDTAGNGVNVQ